jgi:hypothetical protein
VRVLIANQTGTDIGYLAGIYPRGLGHLYSPGSQTGPFHYLPYALDNGAFISFLHGHKFDVDAWKRLLDWAALSGQSPLWALAPDVVSKKAETLELWDKLKIEITQRGFRTSFALQDGMRPDEIPHSDFYFLGGSTEWKLETLNSWCTLFPNRVHVGRVNTFTRLMKAYRAGACSVDGTGWFHHAQKNDLITYLKGLHSQ